MSGHETVTPMPQTQAGLDRTAAGQRSSSLSPSILAMTGMMAATLAVLSWASLPLPFSPVPLTLQTLGVLLAGALLGRVWGPVSVGVFILLGLVGLPVFHNGASGPGVLVGPTGGFLVGFLGAAFVMGLAGDFARRTSGRRALALLAAGAVVASLVIYAAGVPWLAAVTGMSAGKAITVGLVPYLPGDAIKAVAAVALARAVGTALERQGLR